MHWKANWENWLMLLNVFLWEKVRNVAIPMLHSTGEIPAYNITTLQIEQFRETGMKWSEITEFFGVSERTFIASSKSCNRFLKDELGVFSCEPGLTNQKCAKCPGFVIGALRTLPGSRKSTASDPN